MSFFLNNAVGFFLQLAPCVLMIFLPFPEESMRVSRKWTLTGSVAAVLALSLLFPVLLRASPADYHTTGNMTMLIAAILCLAAFIGLVQESRMKKILVFFVVLFYAVIQFWLVNAAWVFLPERYFITPESGVYSPAATLLYAVSAAVTFPVMLVCVLRPLGEFIQEMEPEEMLREFVITLLSTTVFVAAMMYVYSQDYDGEYYHLVVLLELLLLLAQVLLYWLLFRESLRRKRDSEQRRALEIQKIQYDRISREMENARRLDHDLRHHMNIIGSLNAQGRSEEIAAYLKQYGAAVDQVVGQRFSGNPVVDGVLSYYLTRAEEMSIRTECEVVLTDADAIDPTDMTVMLGNCLENALDAQSEVPPERRNLSIKIRTVKAMLLVRIQNSCGETGDSGEPSSWTRFSSSGDRARRGIGLSSVNAIAKKYSGSALFQQKDGVFTTRIILNPRQNPEQSRGVPG